MTIMFHDTPLPPHRDARMAVVYYDRETASYDSLQALLERPTGPRVKTIPTHLSLDSIPTHLRPYLPGPPRDDTEFPLVVAVYEGDVVSWAGHQPHLIQAWISQPHTVGAHITRSATRTQALDRGDVSYWDIPSTMLRGHTTSG